MQTKNATHKTTKPILGMAIFTLLIFASGCVITTTGQSSGQMKKNLKKTEFYRLTKAFYPNGITEGHLFDSIPKASLREIQSRANKSTTYVCGKIKDKKSLLKEVFTSFDDTFSCPKIKISNFNKPIAKYDRHGEIQIDVRILQSLFIGSLAAIKFSNIEEDSFYGPNLFGSNTQRELKINTLDDSEQVKLVESVVKITNKIDQSKGKSRVGDLTGVLAGSFSDDFDFDENSWFTLTDIVLKSNSLEVAYFDAISFLIAHEISHKALNHYSKGQLDESGKETEFSADKFAILALSSFTDNSAAASNAQTYALFFDRPEGISTYLSYAYNLINYYSDKEVTYTYPTATERLGQAISVLTLIQTKHEKSEQEKFDDWREKYGEYY